MKHTKHLLVLCTALLLGLTNAWGADFSQTYSYGLTGWSLTNYDDKSSYYIVPSTGTSSVATISGIFTGKTITSNVVITINCATYGSGTNPSATTFAVYTASDCATAVTATQGGTLPTSKTYQDVTYTITQSNAVTFTNDLAIKITKPGKQIRLKSIKVVFTYEPASSSCTQLAAPTNLAATNITSNSAEISWNAVPNATGYKVTYTSMSTGDLGEQEVTTTSATIDGLTPETTYTWTVKAIGDGTTYCDSEESTDADLTTAPLPKYTITWIAGGNALTPTQVTQGEKIGTLPTNPEQPVGCTDKVFVGWSAANIGTGGQDNAPDLITAETVPTGDVTYYAIFATKTTTGGGSGGAAVGTMLWAENFDHFGTKTPSAAGIGSGTTIYGGVTITYNQSSTSTKGYAQDLAGGTAPELLLAKNNETWTIDGIKTGSATEMSLTLVSNKTSGITPSSTTSGIAISGDFGAWTIKNDGTSETFNLTFENTTGSNIRIDNIELSITAAGGGSTTTYTGYVTGCEECTAPSTPLSITAAETVLNLDADGNASTTFSTAGGNDGTITYTVTPSTGSISGNTVTFTATGVYTLRATQDKNGSVCSQNVAVQIEVKATPVVTLVAADPLEIKAKCGATATAEVQVTAYNCGTTDVTIASSNGNITISPTSFKPDADGKVNGTVTVSYTASAGGTDETHTATLSAKCGTVAGQNTLTVNAVKDGCTPAVVLFYDRGAQYQSFTNKYAGDEITAAEVPDPTGVCTEPVAYVFDGWATATVADGSTTYTKVNFPCQVTGDQTYYAVYKYAEGGGTGGSDNYDWETTETGNWTVDDKITRTSGEGVGGGYAGKINTAKTYVTYNNKVAVTSFSFDFKRTSSNSNYNVYIETSEDKTTWTTAATYAMSSFKNGSYGTTTTHTFDGSKELYVRFYCYNTTAVRYVDNVSISYGGGGSTYYTSSPACGPYVKITGSKELYITSGNVGGRSTVQAHDTIYYTAGSLKSNAVGNAPKVKVPPADITIGGTPTTVVSVEFGEDSVCTKNADGTYSIAGSIVVRYKPTAVDTRQDINVQLRAEYNTGSDAVLDAFTVHARSLPRKFVIAAKQGDKWYAMPADMADGSKPYDGNGQLVVDNTDNPTKAAVTPCNTIYTFDGQKQGGDLRYVRFVGLDGKYLWASSTGNTGIKNDGSETTVTAANTSYNWLLTSTDNVSYTFGNENTDRTLRLSTDTKFGMYTSGVADLRILPIVEADTCAYNAAPTGLVLAARTSTTLTLEWNAVAGADRYQYSTDGGTTWNNCTIDNLDEPEFTLAGLSAKTEYTVAIRAAHGTATRICSDAAQITATTANCDNVPTISGTISEASNCGTLTLTATGIMASTDNGTTCPITKFGFQYTQDATWKTYEQTEHDGAPAAEINDEITVERGGTYYVRIYATNEVGTGHSASVSINVSGLANLKIVTAGDATTAPMIGNKASLRVGWVSESTAPVTWSVIDGTGTSHPDIAAAIDATGQFTATAYGIYRISVTQAATADYCEATAVVDIEVRRPQHYGYVTNCAVLNNNNLEVISVSQDDITFGIDDADVVQIEIVKENTGGSETGGGSQAEGLFFSKYYEATGNVKLVAVFNGTGKDIDVTNYTIKYGKTSWESSYIKLGNFTNTSNVIAAGEEVILYTTGNQKNDNDIMNCVNEAYPDGPWKEVTAKNSGGSGTLSFAGDKTIALFEGTTLVDVIGVVKEDGTPATTGIKTKTNMLDPNGVVWCDASGWYCATGQSIKDGAVIATSTNRCLLVRKNTVVSGANAVSLNKSDFATLCDEWLGEHVPDNAEDNGVAASCENFAYIGAFNYGKYFQRYDPVTGRVEKESVDLKQNTDGTWTLSTSAFEGTAWENKNFHDLACTTVRINGYQKKADGKDSLSTALNYKIPIIVDKNTDTKDNDLFGFAGEGRLVCPECDVVVRDAKKLDVIDGGYNNIRNMWVYSGASLNIQNNKNYTLGRLVIESENNDVGYALIKGTLKAQDGIEHTKRIDANAWYDFSLPYGCNVSEIVRTNGKTLGTYGTDWVIKYYDGQKRAETGTPNGAAPTNWATVPANGTLEAGKGYIVGLGGIHNANSNYKVRFVLPNRSTQPYIESVTDNVTRQVKGYTGTKAQQLPCHKGWNYIGNPYVSRFDGTEQRPAWDEGVLLLDGYYTDQLTGQTYDVVAYPDIYVAVDMGSGGATNWVQTKASEALLHPFRAFLVQAVSDGMVDFNKDARNLPQLAPAMRSTDEPEVASTVRLNVSSTDYGTGRTTVMLHSDYTDNYDLGYDMICMFNTAADPQPFTLNATGDYLLYNAANRQQAETDEIPVGIRTSAKGDYTFGIDRSAVADRYAAIYLIDRAENGLKFDLLQGDYTTALARGTNTTRFALRFERRASLPTEVGGETEQSSPIVYRDKNDIVVENLPLDATVRVVDAIGRTLYVQPADGRALRFVAPVRGAYIIQVMTQENNFSIKTIL